MKGIIIEGSARSTGNTALVASEFAKQTGFELIHLCNYNIAHFEYNFKNQADNFLPLIRRIAEEYELIVFITPVYWYSMSGRMKVFFDRISDCLYIHKETGRKLRGMNMIAISSSEEDRQYDGFFMPFRNSANYLGMKYLGNMHTWVEGEDIPSVVKNKIRSFLKKCNIPLTIS